MVINCLMLYRSVISINKPNVWVARLWNIPLSGVYPPLEWCAFTFYRKIWHISYSFLKRVIWIWLFTCDQDTSKKDILRLRNLSVLSFGPANLLFRLYLFKGFGLFCTVINKQNQPIWWITDYFFHYFTLLLICVSLRNLMVIYWLMVISFQ